MLSTIFDWDVEVTKKLPLVQPTTKLAMVVDKFVQLCNYYPSGRHAKKLWKVLFFNLLDMAITNAPICHKLKYNTSLLDFRDQLVEELFGDVDLRKKRNALDEPLSSGRSISSVEAHVFVNNGKLIVVLHKKVGGPQKVKYAQNSVVSNVIRDFVGIKRDCFCKYHVL